VLLNGTRYEGTPGQRDYNIVEFERYAIRIDSVPPKEARPWARTMSTPELLRERSLVSHAELDWRVGLPISAVILALLAIPLSYVNPRAGRSLNMVLAIVLYMLYSNLISVSNSWVAQGRLSPGIGLWGIHAVMLAVTLLMFRHRMTLAPWRFGKGRVRQEPST
jgi:lipopolysaccharide export system permease protein